MVLWRSGNDRRGYISSISLVHILFYAGEIIIGEYGSMTEDGQTKTNDTLVLLCRISPSLFAVKTYEALISLDALSDRVSLKSSLEISESELDERYPNMLIYRSFISIITPFQNYLKTILSIAESVLIATRSMVGRISSSTIF